MINQRKTKSINISSNDLPPSLSIEERVKLRRTKPLQPSTTIVEIKKSQKMKTHPIQQDVKQIRQSMTQNSSKKMKSTKTSPIVSTIKSTKLFLGSGLDLDNIVLGNRQRRCVQT